MAKIFLVLSIIASLAAGYFGWQTTEQITRVKGSLKTTQDNLKSTTASWNATKATLADTEGKLKISDDNLGAEKAKTATLETEKAQITGERDAAVAKTTEVQAQLDKTVADLNALKAATGHADNSDGKSIVDQQIAELKAQLAEKETILKSTQAKADEAEQRASALQAEKTAHAQKVNKIGLEGTVMAVNNGYNFAVISIGDRAGAITNAQVDVKRGDTLIAKLRITTVENSTSIADIIPDTVAKGQQVRPGDRVIFTGQLVKEN